MVAAADLDVVTLDALGTLVELGRSRAGPATWRLPRTGSSGRTPMSATRSRPRSRTTSPARTPGAIRRRSRRLRQDCAGVFLEACQADLDPAAFAPDFDAAIEFRLLPDVIPALDALQAAGLSLACVANWDISLTDHLERSRPHAAIPCDRKLCRGRGPEARSAAVRARTGAAGSPGEPGPPLWGF